MVAISNLPLKLAEQPAGAEALGAMAEVTPWGMGWQQPGPRGRREHRRNACWLRVVWCSVNESGDRLLERGSSLLSKLESKTGEKASFEGGGPLIAVEY